MVDAAGSTQIQFQGSPRNLQGLVAVAFQEVASRGLPLLELRSPPAEVGDAPLTLQIEGAGQFATWLRFSLPEATPPGRYDGTVSIGDEQYPCVIAVKPRLFAAIAPRRLTLEGAPGAELDADLTMVNTGNVAFEIPKVSKVGLLDVKGPERAMGLALRDATAEGEKRVSLFAQELSRSHGGRLVLTIEGGAGQLAPGEFRHLNATLRLPADLKAGRIYIGEWMLLNRSYSIEVIVVDEAPAQGESK